MAFIVEQKIKGRIYLYSVESYWNKEKKQSRQKRTYIGPKNRKTKQKSNLRGSNLVSKNFGNVYLLVLLANRLGLTDILKCAFPNDYLEILSLAYYEISDASPSFLFHYWLEEQNLPEVKKLHSSGISELCDRLGRSEKQRTNVTRDWIEQLKPINAVFYDITSISSYSTGVEFVEWGYNRDKEKLPQINMGVTFCQNSLLPMFYTLYPGSIVDVTTLRNCMKYLDIYNLEEVLFILDRGFFSKANILEMNNRNNKIKFIQPLPFSLKKYKDLIKRNKKKLSNPVNAFKFNEEILFHLFEKIEFDGNDFDGHLFFNEKSEVDQRHHFLSSILEVEKKIKNKKLSSLKEYMEYKKSNIPEKYLGYFKWSKASGKIERNIRNINAYISRMGTFLMLTNQENLSREEVLSHYRQRDKVEKVFDISKNEMDGNRLRAHDQYKVNGRLFIKFIALIIHSEISKTMKEKKLFEKFSVKEVLSELKKIKFTKIGEAEPFLSEISKKQKNILESFGVNEEISHSY
jgi:transposase